MPALSNPRYERFAQALFAGLAGETVSSARSPQPTSRPILTVEANDAFIERLEAVRQRSAIACAQSPALTWGGPAGLFVLHLF